MNSEHFEILLSILNSIHRSNKDFVGLVRLTQGKGGFYNQIIDIQNKLGFIVISCLCFKHSFLSVLEEANSESEENNEFLRKYMEAINKELNKKKKPTQVELSQLENALVIVNEIEAHIS